ncbi:hypothetical protein [Ideonella sp. YS5]|uniref:hypothetical protein n=1 Tax=Ideonella sp. YS5 TaxID=3453714 RepID=UPI003EEAC6E2
MPIEELLRGRQRRQRRPSFAADALPPLTQAERALLADWAKAHARKRSVAMLQQLAGPTRLDLVEPLAEKLLLAGWAALDEEHRGGRWWLKALHWADLASAQQALGLRTREERDRTRAALDGALTELAAQGPPELKQAVEATIRGRLTPRRRQARLELLQALVSWQAAQRRGMPRDFALHARPHTKAISDLEWTWLRGHFDLEAWGIEPLAHTLWIAGSARLRFGASTLELAGLPFIGLPQKHFSRLTAVDGVRRHWLVENRTSFERQAAQCPEDTLITWLPGRPSAGWCEAWVHLLRHAPVPVLVSADADPAGVEIALAAGAVCGSAGVAWQPHAMEPHRLASGRPLPLNDYDHQTLERLKARSDLPPGLAELVEAMAATGVKHEQEAWL